MQGENPYQQPQADVMPLREASEMAVNPPRGRDIGAGWRWIADGWRVFKSAWVQIFFGLLLLWLISMAIQWVPLVGFLASMILTPVFSVGLLVLAWKADEGQSPSISDIFAGFQNKFPQLVMLGLAYMGLILGAALIVGLLAYLLMADALVASFAMLEAMEEGGAPAFADDMMLRLALLVLLFMAVMLPVMAMYWFSPALVFFGNRGIGESLKESLMGCLKNILPMFWYSIVMIILMILAVIPLGLGLLVLLPVLAVSYYSSFRDIYTDTL
ncbi:BPSS1780 family membrane protein [Isoalcanivorax indicus]|uniref:BPSS1780 family membrane protein n=1 Tax=Isoalcanivorax indicus TaxID=2202653 RepID=UPI000DBAC68F|nr:BPSS1780 family membrane protein [Isoalcanivorax indicus]